MSLFLHDLIGKITMEINLERFRTIAEELFIPRWEDTDEKWPFRPGGGEAYVQEKVLDKAAPSFTKEVLENDVQQCLLNGLKAHYNLLSQFEFSHAKKFVEEMPVNELRNQILTLFYGSTNLLDRISNFLDWAEVKPIQGEDKKQGINGTACSYFLALAKPKEYSYCKPTAYKAAVSALLSQEDIKKDPAERIVHCKEIYSEVLKVLENEYGLIDGNLLDVHSLFYLYYTYSKVSDADFIKIMQRYKDEGTVFQSTSQGNRYYVSEVSKSSCTVERLDAKAPEKITTSAFKKRLNLLKENDGSLEFNTGFGSTVAVRNTVLQARPFGLTYDKKTILDLSNDETALDNFCDIVTHLNVNNTDGKPTLYKPAMIACVIESIKSGELEENKVKFDWVVPRFIEKMKLLGVDATEENAAMPFFHLTGDQFWMLCYRDTSKIIETGTAKSGPIRSRVRHAIIKDTYWNVLQDPEKCEIALNKLAKKWWPDQKHYWIFQCNPKTYDINRVLKKDLETSWAVRQYADDIKVGDHGFLWKSGEDAGIVATFDVIKSPDKDIQDTDPEGWINGGGKSDELRCLIRIKEVFPDVVVKRTDLKDTAFSKDISIIKQSAGTNFKITKEEYEKINKMIKEPSMKLRELIKLFAQQFKADTSITVQKTLPIYQTLCVDGVKLIEKNLEKQGLRNQNTLVSASIGQGNKTSYPWLAVLDTRITNSVLKGYYIVYLFSDDMSELYLTFNQGSTKQSKDEVNQNREKVFSAIQNIFGFQKGELPPGSLTKIKAGSAAKNGKAYEKTNLFYKRYNIESLPHEEDLIDDLKLVFNAYQKVINPKGEPPMDIKISHFAADLLKAGLFYRRNLLTRFMASCLTKRFVILTGLSGSGKTKLAQALSQWICEADKKSSDSENIQIEVTMNKSAIEHKGWTLDINTIEKMLGQKEQIVNVNIAGQDVEECQMINLIQLFYKNTDKENEIVPYLLQNFENGDKIPITIKMPLSQITKNDQYLIVPVGADWTNREPLLGYPNALEPGNYITPENGVVDLLIEASKKENSNKPYFLILDEMNLSHVERYFADFLSAMESEEAITLHPGSDKWKVDGTWKDGIPDKIKLPGNLFIIGTVNIDETTYMFSPKVLDRANVIEFSVSDKEMEEFLQNPAKPNLKSLIGAGTSMAADFVRISEEEISEFDNKEKINKALLEFFIELKKTGSEFGYRSASEIFRFAGVLSKLTGNDGKAWNTNDVIDAALMQKLLPKIHGSRKKLEAVLDVLAKLCISADEDKIDDIITELEKAPGKIDGSENVRFKISLEKILRMKNRVVQEGFTSFAEA